MMEKVFVRLGFQIKGRKHSHAGSEEYQSLEKFFQDLIGIKTQDHDSYNLRVGMLFTFKDIKYKVVDIQLYYNPRDPFADGTKQPFLDTHIFVEQV